MFQKEPNIGSLQKPVGGRSLLPQKHASSMQKTVGNRNSLHFSIYKGGYRKKSQQIAGEAEDGKRGLFVCGVWSKFEGEKGERAKK